MPTNSRWLRVLALLLGLTMFAAACGDDDDSSSPSDDPGSEEDGDGETAGGGELVNFGTFVGDPPEHIDPALSVTLNAYQVISSLYDGLTDLDFSSGEPEIKPHLAESAEPNEDGSVWTFTIKEGQAFSNGEEILPSTFKRPWERAAAMQGLKRSGEHGADHRRIVLSDIQKLVCPEDHDFQIAQCRETEISVRLTQD